MVCGYLISVILNFAILGRIVAVTLKGVNELHRQDRADTKAKSEAGH
jgi:large-conductance mechanosensitive channel